MKKLILIVALIATVTSVSAQGRPQFGLKGGLNIAELKVEGVNDLKSRTSFHLGFLAHIHISEYIAIQPEVMFSGQGMRDKVANTDVDYNLNYINIPFLFQYMTGNGLRLQTGPQLGFLTSAKINDIDNKNNFKSVDLSWTFGAGYLTRAGLGFDARYNLGLTDINDNGTNDIKNRVFQVGIFFMMRGR